MREINRRQIIAALGTFGGSAALAGCGAARATSDSRIGANDRSSNPAPYRYVTLDPDAVAADAYAIYPDGGCMYAVVGSVIRALAERVGEPFRSFPYEMMRYGDGGVGGWGSVCGVVNGAAALLGMFQSEKSKTRRESLIGEFCLWYEQSALPQFQPVKPQWADRAEPSVAASVLCHISISNWCKETGCEASSMEKKERCRRLSADGAKCLVEMLNANAAENPGCLKHEVLPEMKACMDCHGPKALNNMHGKMDCRACHAFVGPHPKLINPSR